jgi:eukaryotic-like serine/threonine-protein kinase
LLAFTPDRVNTCGMDPARWKKLSELFERTIELGAADRQAWIVDNCPDDTMLRSDLERMLAADAQAQGYLEVPLAKADAPLWHADEGGAQDYPPGSRQFGPYRLLRLIGRGGMGEVHLAERSDGQFEQRVALKLLPHPTPGLVQRFRQERQILARLEHPNIARLLDGGVGEEGVPYFVMDHVQGEAITRYAQDNELSVRERLELFLRVGDAVQYAHRNLVVHRDLKPSNILVSDDGTVKLLDFGIAKVLEITGERDATHTATRLFTPDYAAPEQIRGERVTTATDVYSLGVIAYELLTDARPYKLGARGESLELAILQVDPLPPSSAVAKGDAQARQLRRELRGDLDRIVLTALAKEPERRYSSVEALTADIERYLAGHAIFARGDSAMYRMRKFILRNRIVVGAAMLVALALLVGSGLALWQAARADRERNAALRTRDFVLGMLSNVGPYRRSLGRGQSLGGLIEASAPRVLEEFADDPQTQIPLLTSFAGVFLSLSRARDSAHYLELALDRQYATHAAPDLIADTQLRIANDYYYMRRFDESERIADSVLADLNRLTPSKPFHKLATTARETKLLIHWVRGDLDGAAQIAQDLIDELRRTLGRQDNETASAEFYYSFVLLDQGRLTQAAREIEHSSRVDLALYPPGYPGRYSDTTNIAWWLILAGDPASAETLASTGLEFRNQLYAGQGFYPAYSHLMRGWARCQLGKYADGLADIDSALVVMGDAANTGYMDLSRLRVRQGQCLLDAGRLPQAREVFSEARKLAGEDGGDRAPIALAADAALARIDWLQGNHKKPIESLSALYQLQLSAHFPSAAQTQRWLDEAGVARQTAPVGPASDDTATIAELRSRLLALATELTEPQAR